MNDAVGRVPQKVLAALLALIATSSVAGAAWAEINVTSVSPRGLQVGGTTLLAIEGQGLPADPRVLLSLDGARQQLKPGGTSERCEIEVTLPDDVPADIYLLRISGDGDLSSPLAIGIDAAPQLPLAEEIAELPVALHGTLTGTATPRTTFQGSKGQSIVVEVEAQRLGAKLNPVVLLLDARGLQLAWSSGDDALSGDARLEVVLPEDGRYTVQLQDAVFQGESPGHFRLKIGSLHYASMTLPLAVQRGEQARLSLADSNIPADVDVLLRTASAADWAPAPWPDLDLTSPTRPAVRISEYPELVEEASPEVQPLPAVPVGVSGRIAEPREEDVYRLSVSPGEKLRVDVLARRAGSPLDGVLTVRSPQGQTIATSDDREKLVDPGLDFEVPGQLTEVHVALRDLAGRGGPRYLYRIAVTPAEQGDFALQLEESNLIVPSGGHRLVRVRADRAGYDGAICLRFNQLPFGVEAAGMWIAAGVNEAIVELHAAGSGDHPVHTRLDGAGMATTSPGIRAAQVSAAPDVWRPWLRSELAMAVGPPAPVRLTWSDSGRPTLPRGGTWTTQLHVSRSPGATGLLRLSLVSTQAMPKKKVMQDGKEVEVDDVERTIRLAEAVELPADVDQAELAILVPDDVPARSYDLALRAELLEAEGETVIATVSSGVLRREAAPANAE